MREKYVRVYVCVYACVCKCVSVLVRGEAERLEGTSERVSRVESSRLKRLLPTLGSRQKPAETGKKRAARGAFEARPSVSPSSLSPSSSSSSGLGWASPVWVKR